MFKFELEDQEKVTSHTIWVEKYRPVNLDEFIGSNDIRATLNKWISNKEVPHALFYSSPGTGKTSIAKILVNNIDCDSLIINASDENSVDDIRNKVQDFAMTMGIQPLKIIVLDECLDENTLVWILRDGIEQRIIIKDLKQDLDLVMSYNFTKKIIEWRPFYLISHGIKETYELEFENGEVVICTDTHKWYVKDDNNNIIRVKTSDIISGKYDYILTTEENRIIPESQ